MKKLGKCVSGLGAFIDIPQSGGKSGVFWRAVESSIFGSICKWGERERERERL